jgi:hypothetical protein
MHAYFIGSLRCIESEVPVSRRESHASALRNGVAGFAARWIIFGSAEITGQVAHHLSDDTEAKKATSSLSSLSPLVVVPESPSHCITTETP